MLTPAVLASELEYEVCEQDCAIEPLPLLDKLFNRIEKGYSKLLGSYHLPKGYKFENVPSDAKLQFESPLKERDSTITYKYNLLQTLTALVQTVSAGYTLYKSRGDQIDTYGYAAFGLSVAPYLVMSVVNTLAQIVTPQYSTVFVVRSPELDEALGRGAEFESIVGSLCTLRDDNPSFENAVILTNDTQKSKVQLVGHDVPDLTNGQYERPFDDNLEKWKRASLLKGKSEQRVYNTKQTVLIPSCSRFELEKHRLRYNWLAKARTKVLGGKAEPERGRRTVKQKFKHWMAYIIGPVLIGAVSVAIIAVLTNGFKPGRSTVPSRVWTMSWLAVGACLGLTGPIATGSIFRWTNRVRDASKRGGVFCGWAFAGLFFIVIPLGLFFAPAIGGFVVVVQQLKLYGDCTSS